MLYGGTSLDQKIQKGLYIFACTNSVMDPIVYGYFNLRKSNRNNRNQVGENSVPIYVWMTWRGTIIYFIIKGFAVIVRWNLKENIIICYSSHLLGLSNVQIRHLVNEETMYIYLDADLPSMNQMIGPFYFMIFCKQYHKLW